jgi:hypothetical protein
MSTPAAWALRELLGPDARLSHRAITLESGVALPPFIDHHVHLHLIDETLLGEHGIAGVVDLGGDPVQLARRPRMGMPHAAYAGAFLTAKGGYPAGRSWAPASIVREVINASAHPGAPGGAATAVDEQASFGASVIKVALNADAGAVPDDAVLEAIVTAARAHDLPVVAHAQGAGTACRAIEAGIDVLAHTPFSERLDLELVRRAATSGQWWISTLDIHRSDPRSLENARANLEAFATFGGAVLYGTDLGNGDLPVGVNAREIAALQSAGVVGADLIEAMADPWPLRARTDAVATFVPGDPPRTDDEIPDWLARATVVPTEELAFDEN